MGQAFSPLRNHPWCLSPMPSSSWTEQNIQALRSCLPCGPLDSWLSQYTCSPSSDVQWPHCSSRPRCLLHWMSLWKLHPATSLPLFCSPGLPFAIFWEVWWTHFPTPAWKTRTTHAPCPICPNTVPQSGTVSLIFSLHHEVFSSELRLASRQVRFPALSAPSWAPMDAALEVWGQGIYVFWGFLSSEACGKVSTWS